MERTKFPKQISTQLNGTNILDGFNYNANHDIGIQNINKNIKNTRYRCNISPSFILPHRLIHNDGKNIVLIGDSNFHFFV